MTLPQYCDRAQNYRAQTKLDFFFLQIVFACDDILRVILKSFVL